MLSLVEKLHVKLENMQQNFESMQQSQQINVNEIVIPQQEKALKGYSDAVRRNQEVIVVKPKNISQVSSKTRQVVEEKINPSSLGVGVSRVKYVRSGGVAIKCSGAQDVKNLCDNMKRHLGQDYEVQVPEKKNPKIKIINIEKDLLNDQEVLLEKIILQNSITTPTEKRVLKIVNSYENKRGKTCVTLEVDSATYEQIKMKDVLYIGWKTCRYIDFVGVIQCYRCWKFGHMKKICKSGQDICPRCSENHELKECQRNEEVCVNCKHAVEVLKITNIDFHHTATSKNCEAYKRILGELKQRVNYPEVFSGLEK